MLSRVCSTIFTVTQSLDDIWYGIGLEPGEITELESMSPFCAARLFAQWRGHPRGEKVGLFRLRDYLESSNVFNYAGTCRLLDLNGTYVGTTLAQFFGTTSMQQHTAWLHWNYRGARRGTRLISLVWRYVNQVRTVRKHSPGGIYAQREFKAWREEDDDEPESKEDIKKRVMHYWTKE